MKAWPKVSLKRIVLRDFVIVSELELDLADGFTVLTGETGAGKSILIDALQLVTGERADTGMIREGAQRTEVSAEFNPSSTISQWLVNTGFDANETLLLRRTVDTQGKSRAWINGSPATATQLRELGEQLFDIHGQHAWQSLTRPEAVRALLDAYAQVNCASLSALWQQWRLAQGALQDASAEQESMQRESERLLWQISEVEKLSPKPDEWADLSTEHSRLSHAQALLDAAQAALTALDDESGSALGGLHTAHQLLQQQEQHETQFKDLAWARTQRTHCTPTSGKPSLTRSALISSTSAWHSGFLCRGAINARQSNCPGCSLPGKRSSADLKRRPT